MQIGLGHVNKTEKMEFKMIQNDSNLHFLEKSRELTWINMICHRFLPSTSIYQIWPSTMVAYWSWPILAWDKPGKAVIQFSRHCLWRQPRSPVSWVSRGSPVGLLWHPGSPTKRSSRSWTPHWCGQFHSSRAETGWASRRVARVARVMKIMIQWIEGKIQCRNPSVYLQT